MTAPPQQPTTLALAEVLGRGPVGVVRVLDRHGFGTVESGQLLAAAADGTVAGGLLGGTVDQQAVPLARGAVAGPTVVDTHVGEHDAVSAGLACGGGATLLGHRVDAEPAAALADAFTRGQPAALVTTADGAASLVLAGPALEITTGSVGPATHAATEHVRALLRRGATLTERTTIEGVDVLVDLWVPVPTILTVGGGVLGQALSDQAGVLGWAYRSVDTLAASLEAITAFTDADVLVLIDHDPAFDELLRVGLGGRGFLGALGSRRTQAARRERLLAAGVPEADIARIHGPVGLDLGARTPAESAVSIVAEVLVARSGRAPAALGAATGPIGA